MTPLTSFSFGPSTPTGVDGALGRMGLTLAQLRTFIDADLAAMADSPSVRFILVNATVNGMGYGLIGPQWQTDLAYIVDALHTKYPSATVYIAKPWARDKGTEPDTLAGYIDDIIASRAAWAAAGPDERVWLENGDNGTTYTADGVHYTAAGNAAAAAQWKAALGY